MSRNMKSLHWLCAFLLVGLLGCKGGSSKPSVSFVSNNPHTFWNFAEAGAKKAAEEAGTNLLFRKPAEGNTNTQQETIDQVLNQGIKGVAISVIDPATQNKYLQNVAKKVSFIAVDNDAPESNRLCYIGTDNYLAGRAAGVLVKEALPDGGVVAIFVGQLEALNARQRRQGVLDELAGKKDVTIKDGETYGKWRYTKTYTDQPQAESRCTEHAVQAITDLQKEKHVCFVGLWEYNPPAILTAVDNTARELDRVKIVGFDENQRTLKAIGEKKIYGTVVQQPFEFGYRSVKILSALAKGEKPEIPESKEILVPHLVVTNEGKGRADFEGKKTEGKTAEEWIKYTNKLLGKE